MALQEEQHEAYGFTGAAVFPFAAAAGAGEESGENRPNKKPKQSKTPQRGLGVAQLERIRLEEQQQKGAATVPASSLPGSFSPVMPLPLLMPLSSTPFPGSSDLNMAARPSIPIPSAPFCDMLIPAPPTAVDGSMVAPPTSLAGHGCLPLLWNPLELNAHDLETSKKMFSFPVPLQDETSKPIWQLPCPAQRHGHHHQQQQLQSKHLLPNPSMVNPSLSPPPLPGIKLRTEPPSNQTNVSNSASPLWPGDEKMAGVKRPWPFHVDTMPDCTSFPCRLPLPPFPFPRADEYPPANGYDLLQFKPGSTSFRDGPPSSGAFQVDWRNLCGYLPDEKYKDISNAPAVHCDSLTSWSSLSPPAPAAALRSKQRASTLLPLISRVPSAVSAPVPHHGNTDDASSRTGGSLQSPEELPFYSFLPMRSSSQETGMEEHRHETVDSLDLELKL